MIFLVFIEGQQNLIVFYFKHMFQWMCFNA